MSVFYGTVSGQATTSATRRGSRNSGITASAQSYDGSVITHLRYLENEDNDDEELLISITLSDQSSCSWGSDYFYGSLEELKECFNMYKEYKQEQERLKSEDYAWYDYDTDYIKEERI